jgi:hypothetical protein
VRVYELAVVVYLAGEIGVVLLRRLEHDLHAVSDILSLPLQRVFAYSGTIAELVGCQVDLAEAALAYEPSQCIVSHGLEVGRGEFTGAPSVFCPSRRYRTQAQRRGLLKQLLIGIGKLLFFRLSQCTNAPRVLHLCWQNR